MPIGLNRTNLNTTGITYKDGFPVTLPLVFGTPVTLPVDFGNVVTTPISYGNVVTWAPSASHFGNIIGGSTTSNGFALESGNGVVLLENGSVLIQE